MEFNRALDRQRRSKEKFAAGDPEKTQEEVEKGENFRHGPKNMDDPALREKLMEAYPSLYNFSVYPDYVNPFATYMAGVFFTIEGDYSKAVDLLKESAGMVADNTYLLQDLDALEQSLNTSASVPSTVWVIFENGLGPIKEESGSISAVYRQTRCATFGIALPRLAFRIACAEALTVTAGGQGVPHAGGRDMDRIVQNRVREGLQSHPERVRSSRQPPKRSASIASNRTTVRPWQRIIMAGLITRDEPLRDVRIWTALPKKHPSAGCRCPKTYPDASGCRGMRGSENCRLPRMGRLR